MKQNCSIENLGLFLAVLFMVSVAGRPAQKTKWEREMEYYKELAERNPNVYQGEYRDEPDCAPWENRVTVTQYNPVAEQCDSTPLITADNSKIDLVKLKKGKLKWVAVSRDLRKHFKYGSTIIIRGAGHMSGKYKVHDTMNPRFTNRVDILTAEGEICGKWEDAWIEKEEEV